MIFEDVGTGSSKQDASPSRSDSTGGSLKTLNEIRKFGDENMIGTYSLLLKPWSMYCKLGNRK